MAKQLTKRQLMTALEAANVSFPATATTTQLKNLYDVEVLENSEPGVRISENSDEQSSPDDVVATNSLQQCDQSVDELIVALEKKRKVLTLLLKQLRELEAEVSNEISSLSIVEIDNIVPKFTGDNAYSVEKFLLDFENTIKMCPGGDHFKFMSLRRLLSGTAAIFLRTTPVKDYQSLKAELLKQFKKQISTNDVYKELQNRHRGANENMVAYMLCMQEIAAQSHIGEEDVITAIIDGLKDKSAHSSILYTAKTYDELKSLLVIYDKRRPSSAPPQLRERSSTETRCFNCSKFGYQSFQCQQPKRVMGSCFRCGSRDHHIKMCPKKTGIIIAAVDEDDPVRAYAVPHEQQVSVAFNNWNMNTPKIFNH